MTDDIRSAVAGDAEAIAAITVEVQALHAAAFPALFKPPRADTFPLDAIRALLLDPDHLFVVAAEEEGGGTAVVGYAYAEVQRRPETSFRYGAVELYVHQMGVRGDRRGRGIGARLLAALREAARARGIARVALNVWTFNERARAFYRAHGFVPFQERLWLTDESNVEDGRGTGPGGGS